MPFFAYKAVNNDGRVIRGTVEKPDIDLAYDNVASSGLHVLTIQESSSVLDFYTRRLRIWSVKRPEIIEFAKNLSVMVRSGMPLMTSISDMAESVDNRKFGERLHDIKRTVELGSSFSSALGNHNDIFPEIFINLIAVGEETGRLDESLSDIALHLQRMEDLKSAITRALMYPVFALVGTLGALLFWLIYVLPKMSALFTSMDVELPVITQNLILASNFSKNYWYIYILLPLFIYIILVLLSKKEATKYYIDSAKLKLPVIRLIVHNKLLALFAEQLRILMSAGVTIDRSLDIMINVIDNVVFKRALLDTREKIMLGSMVSDALKGHRGLFPNMVMRMIAIGESTGDLNEQLNYLSEYFLDKLDDISNKLGKMIEPLVILVIGGMFMIIILGLLSPIYDLISGIGS
jgi:type II secretory pathway component PulF